MRNVIKTCRKSGVNPAPSGALGEDKKRSFLSDQRSEEWFTPAIMQEAKNYSVPALPDYGEPVLPLHGQRAVKFNGKTEQQTLYYNRMWQVSGSGGNWKRSKHIYVGEARIATKFNVIDGGNENNNTVDEKANTYYYHSDHLGSAEFITDATGRWYERIEYTPYGETWIEEKNRDGTAQAMPYRFTGKELDEETGLYYYGARYLDPRTSRWMSADPAMGEYIPSAPINDQARRRNQNLPGMGGVFNYVNLHVYHYAGNNPVRYVDPDGRISIKGVKTFILGFIPIVVKVNINYRDGVLAVGLKIGVGVGEGFQIDVSDHFDPEVETPDTGYTIGLYTGVEGSSKMPGLEVSVEAEGAQEIIDGEVNESTSVAVSVTHQPFIATEYRYTTDEGSTTTTRPSVGYGSTSSAMIIGVGGEIRFSNGTE
jgi:RHS repeat-associated protein